jgi:hypothetical protein
MPPSQFQCNICSKRFTRKENLEGHLRCHNSEKPFQCPKCNKTFGHASELSRHRKSHSKQRKYICSGFEEGGMRWGCEKQFTRLEGLKNHLSKSKAGKICATQRINAQAGSSDESFHVISEQSSTSSNPPNRHEENISISSAIFVSEEDWESFNTWCSTTVAARNIESQRCHDGRENSRNQTDHALNITDL